MERLLVGLARAAAAALAFVIVWARSEDRAPVRRPGGGSALERRFRRARVAVHEPDRSTQRRRARRSAVHAARRSDSPAAALRCASPGVFARVRRGRNPRVRASEPRRCEREEGRGADGTTGFSALSQNEALKLAQRPDASAGPHGPVRTFVIGPGAVYDTFQHVTTTGPRAGRGDRRCRSCSYAARAVRRGRGGVGAARPGRRVGRITFAITYFVASATEVSIYAPVDDLDDRPRRRRRLLAVHPGALPRGARPRRGGEDAVVHAPCARRARPWCSPASP